MTETGRGLYFEDFAVGRRPTTPVRSATPTDIGVRGREIRNQHGTVVQRMETTLMYRCRGAA